MTSTESADTDGTTAIAVTTAPAKTVTLEVGGTKPGCRPTTVPDARVLDCTCLPNPHRSIKAGRLHEKFAALLEWTQTAKPSSGTKLQLLAKRVANELLAGRNVRVECLGGRHRSQVVARLALMNLKEEDRRKVAVEYLDAPPLE